MSYELNGKVKLIMDTMTFASGFTKREFVVTTEENYPQDVKFECVKDKTSVLDTISEGDQVVVHFDVRGNEYKDKYYVNLNAWRITAGEAGASPNGGETAATGADLPPPASEEDMGDLPF
jgi:single-strand DNA-binding protein